MTDLRALDKPFPRPAPGYVAGPTMVFTTYLFVFYFLPLVLVSYFAAGSPGRQAGASAWADLPGPQFLSGRCKLRLLRLVESLVHLLDAGDHRRELCLRTDHRPAGDQPEAEPAGS